LTELGAVKSSTVVTRKVASAFGGAAAIIVIFWLLRGLFGISAYSLYFLLAILGFLFLAAILKTRTNAGAVRAVSSFFGNLSLFSLGAIITIWVLGWIASLQGGGFPKVLYASIPDLVIATLATGVVALTLSKIAPPLEAVRPTGKPMVVNAGTSVNLDGVELSTINEGLAVPMRFSKKSSGYVLFSDLGASMETPMGVKEIKLKAPFIVSGIPFLAKNASEEDLKKLSGKSSKELSEEAKSVVSSVSEWDHLGEAGNDVDLPFVHVSEGVGGSDVDVGPIHVRTDNTGDHVNIGPFSFDDEDGRPRHSGRGRKEDRDKGHRLGWFAYSKTGTKISSVGGAISAKWNGSSISLRGNYMRLTVGGDSFEYDPHEIKTTSPLHTLRVTQSVITLETSKLTINVYASRVLLRTAEGKTKSTESAELASDLKKALTGLAMKQVRDLLAGEPIDLEEMLVKTEEVLVGYD
jgi:hypothetical protein